MRQLSLDVPDLVSRRRMGLVRNQVTGNLYRVTIDNATISASTFDPSAIVRGERVSVVWHPERNFWEIEQIAEGVIRSVYLLQVWNANAVPDVIHVATLAGGTTYETEVSIHDSGSAAQVHDIYYERWNGILQPNRVHVVKLHDAGSRGFYYNYIDLGSGAPVLGIATPTSVVGATFTTFDFTSVSIIVTPNGRIRIDGAGFSGQQGRYSDNDGGSWTDVPSNLPLTGAQKDLLIGWHDRSTGLDDSILWFHYNFSTGVVSLKRGTADGSAALTTTSIVTVSGWTNPGGQTAGVNWSTTMNSNGNGHISLILWDSDVLATSKSLKAWDIYGATVTAKTDVVTSETYVQLCALTRLPSGVLRAFYTKDSLAVSSAVEIYYKDSADEMDTWGAETLWYDAQYAISKLAIDPLPGIGPVTDESPIWWVQSSTSLVIQLAEGVPIQPLPAVSVKNKELAANTRGQVAWITTP